MTHKILFNSLYRWYQKMPFTYEEAFYTIYNSTKDGAEDRERMRREETKIKKTLTGVLALSLGR